MRTKTSLSQKIFLVILGSVLALFVIEAVLQAGGMTFLFFQEKQNRKSLKGADLIKVMCVGESTTALGGADSYPSQLETQLNARSSGQKFTVINKGVPMTNTGIMAAELGPWLDAYDPDIVVLMIGINDHNPLIPVDLYEISSRPFLNKFQTYKLIRWLIKGWRYRFQKDRLISQGISLPRLSVLKIKEAVKEKMRLSGLTQIADAQSNRELMRLVLSELATLSEWVPDNEDMHAFIGDVLLRHAWYEELPQVIDYFLGRTHHHRWPYDQIALGCRNPRLRPIVVDHLLQKIQAAPKLWTLQEFLGTCYAEAGDLVAAQQYFDHASDLRKQTLDPLTQQNYVQIIRTLQKKGVRFVLVQYPMRDLQTLKFLLEDQISIQGFAFVDNEKSFRDAVSSEGYAAYFTDRFGGDFGHCTLKGNGLLADNVADVILNFLSGRRM
ncbi:MAG TPA: GDSL-type esterase/lipase family protein [Candidatus Bathyarchaeia archaeon]|nr:GDSL-type esterase/lipase family protein [Candidatus Bathyarchaeia archaeon]